MSLLARVLVLGWALLAGAAANSLSDRVGQSSRYRLTFDIQMRAEYQGQGEVDPQAKQVMEALQEGMELRTAMEYERRLVAVDTDGTRTFEVRWHDYQYDAQLGGREIPPPPGHQDAVRNLLLQTARVRTTPTGRTVDVEYSSPQLDGLARSAQQDGGMPTFLPEEPVGPGDRWTSSAEFPVGLGAGNMTLELEHTLIEIREGPEGPIAVIELAGSYSQLQGAEEIGLGVPMHLQTSLTGSTLFDVSRGRFVDGRYEIDMFALQAAEGIEIHLTGHANGILELLDTR
jgi:hypothetical protein